MNLEKLVSISIGLLIIQACSHPIEIEGEGDVASASISAGSTVCSTGHDAIVSAECRAWIVPWITSLKVVAHV